jgi:hypothetical protein
MDQNSWPHLKAVDMLTATNATQLAVQMLLRRVRAALIVLVSIFLLSCLKHMRHAGPMKHLHELESHSQRED